MSGGWGAQNLKCIFIPKNIKVKNEQLRYLKKRNVKGFNYIQNLPKLRSHSKSIVRWSHGSHLETDFGFRTLSGQVKVIISDGSGSVAYLISMKKPFA